MKASYVGHAVYFSICAALTFEFHNVCCRSSN